MLKCFKLAQTEVTWWISGFVVGMWSIVDMKIFITAALKCWKVFFNVHYHIERPWKPTVSCPSSSVFKSEELYWLETLFRHCHNKVAMAIALANTCLFKHPTDRDQHLALRKKSFCWRKLQKLALLWPESCDFFNLHARNSDNNHLYWFYEGK